MNSFRTVVVPDKPTFHLSHSDGMVSIGSCFSEGIGKKFQEHRFHICVNPFGQQYNPHSIANALHRLLEARAYTGQELFEHDEQFHSFDHHSSFSRSTSVDTLQVINTSLKEASEALKKASVLYLTFGTAHVFRLKENARVVSNCHKLPGTNFNQVMMKPDEIVSVLRNALLALWQANEEVKVVLTVSPVRYFAFGAHENSVSKSFLFTAIHQLQQQFPQLYYFPAYEFVIDDLRDYRFFTEDMLHPNHQAIEYIWQRLCETLMSEPTKKLLPEIEELNRALLHRPRNPNSEAHKKFLERTRQKTREMEKQYGVTF